MHDESDDELVRRIFRGDRRAWDVFYLRHHHHKLRLARHRSRSDADAEDLTAAFWLKVLGAVGSGKTTPSEPGRWMATVFKNTVIDLFGRSAARRHESLHEDPARDTAAWVPDPDDRIHLREIMASVNQRERAVIEGLLRGDSIVEIAGQMGVDESTVRGRIASIRARFEGASPELKRRRMSDNP